MTRSGMHPTYEIASYGVGAPPGSPTSVRVSRTSYLALPLDKRNGGELLSTQPMRPQACALFDVTGPLPLACFRGKQHCN